MSDVENELSILTPNEMLRKIFKDLYFGNGKPALTLRVSSLEEQGEMIKEVLEKQEEWQSRMTTFMIGTLVSSVGGLILICVELMLRK